MSYPPQGAASAALTSVRAGYIDELAPANMPADLDAVRTITDALEVLTETGGTITSDDSEQTVYVNNAPDGVYVPEYVSIDFSNHTVTETGIIRQYRRYRTGGDWIKIDQSTPIIGLPDPAGIDVVLKPNRYGIKVTLEVDGAAREYDWEVFYKT